jgi:hypothetical protein
MRDAKLYEIKQNSPHADVCELFEKSARRAKRTTSGPKLNHRVKQTHGAIGHYCPKAIGRSKGW